MSFADKLKQARHDMKITQRELAKEIGYNPAVIATIESGSRKPSRNVAIALAKFFGTSTDYWLKEDNGLAKGMALGAAIGSVVPGIGTIIGGAVGGLVGMFNKENDFTNTRGISKELIDKKLITLDNINNLNDNVKDLLLSVIQKDLTEQLQNKAIEDARKKALGEEENND